MRKHLSVLMLVVRSSIYRLLLVWLSMLTAESIFFLQAMRRSRASGLWDIEAVLRQSGMAWGLGAAFILTTLILCSTGCQFGSQPGYTLRRLSISEKAVFFWQSLYNICCYILLWGVQILIAVVFAKICCMQMDSAALKNQTLLLSFYRNSFLHCLFPLSEIWLWIRNGILAIGMGLAAAQYPFRQRRGKTIQIALPMAIVILVLFVRDLGIVFSDVCAIGFAIWTAAMALYHVLGREREDEEA